MGEAEGFWPHEEEDASQRHARRCCEATASSIKSKPPIVKIDVPGRSEGAGVGNAWAGRVRRRSFLEGHTSVATGERFGGARAANWARQLVVGRGQSS